MFCSKCGKEIPDYSTFCPLCGQKQGESPSTKTDNGTSEEFPLLVLMRFIKKHIKTSIFILLIILIAIIVAITYRNFSKEQADINQQETTARHSQNIIGKYVSDIGKLTLCLNSDQTATLEGAGLDIQRGYWEEKGDIGIIEINFSQSFNFGWGDYYSTLYFCNNTLWLSMSAMRSLDYNKSFKMGKVSEVQTDDYKINNENFLKNIATKPEIKKLCDGVYAKVIKEGKGRIPSSTSRVKVNYEGRTIDGHVFDSSYARGEAAEFRIDQVIQGFTIAISNMPVGSIWEVYISSVYGYGEREVGDIKPYSTLIFKIELLSIKE